MSLKSYGRKLTGLTLALAASSCGMYLGPNAIVPLSGDKVPVGFSAGYEFSPSGSRGLVLGAETSIAPPGEGAGRNGRGWGSGTLGYGYEPVPDETHLGVEVKAGPAAGILPDRGGYPFSIGWTYEVDAIYRLSPTKRPWELGDHTLTYPVLIPSFQVVQLVPLGEGHDHGLATTFVFGIALRVDSWLAVEP